MSSNVLPAIAEDAEKLSPRSVSLGKGEDSSLKKQAKQQQLPQIPHRAPEDSTAQSKAQWENQIAKHILSLFASSQVLEKYSEGKALMEFVDGDDEDDINTTQRNPPSKIVLSQLKKPKKKKPKDVVKKTAVIEEDPRKEDIKMIKSLQKRILKEEEEDDEYGNKYRTNTVIKSKTGEDIIVRGQPKCYPIWFVSSGEVYSDWSGLPGGKKLQAQLNNLYEKRQFIEYLGILEKILVGLWRELLYGESASQLMKEPKFGITAEYASTPIASTSAKSTNIPAATDDQNNLPKRDKNPVISDGSPNPNFGSVLSWSADGHVHVSAAQTITHTHTNGGLHANTHGHSHKVKSDRVIAHGGVLKSDSEVGKPNHATLTEFWKLLVLTCNAMGVLSVERKQFELAMDIFRKAEEWADSEEFLKSKILRRELRAHVADAMAYFFFKKSKALAAMSYSSRALENYELCGNIDGIATCLLHIAAAQSLLGKHKLAHKKLFEFLAMIESGRLALADSTPKQLCLTAIGYHNLAAVQLKLQLPDLACKNSQNARRLARLCLSYSNRYIHVFQYTHEIAIADIKWELARKKAEDLTEEQMRFIKDLSESLFAPHSDLEEQDG
eukprot:gene31285-40655_t